MGLLLRLSAYCSSCFFNLRILLYFWNRMVLMSVSYNVKIGLFQTQMLSFNHYWFITFSFTVYVVQFALKLTAKKRQVLHLRKEVLQNLKALWTLRWNNTAKRAKEFGKERSLLKPEMLCELCETFETLRLKSNRYLGASFFTFWWRGSCNISCPFQDRCRCKTQNG